MDSFHKTGILKLALTMGGLALSGCMGAPKVPAEIKPASFTLQKAFEGHREARGSFSAITGQRRQFVVQIHGTQQGETLILKEDFVYDDGERDQKTWVLKPIGNDRFEGTREDVVGKALGRLEGNVFRLSYKVRLKDKSARPDQGLVVQFEDAIVLTSDDRVVNLANVGLWGLKIAHVELTMTRAVP